VVTVILLRESRSIVDPIVYCLPDRKSVIAITNDL
jgi:hypothetical protein